MKKAARPLEDLTFKPIGLAIAAVVAGVAPSASLVTAAQMSMHASTANDAPASAPAHRAAAVRQGDLFDL